jgi:hypothetical protein
MSRSGSASGRTFWVTPAFGVLMGIVYFVAAAVSGHPVLGLALFGLMVVFSAAVVLASRRSETVRGLLDRRDERMVGIDLRATAAAGLAVILAVIAGAVVELARGHSGTPYIWLGALGGVVYVGAVVVLRVRH